MIGVTIISYDTKNIYVRTWPDQQHMDTPFFLPRCTLDVEGEEAVWNWTDVLHMFGLHFRWLVARLRQAPPELSSKHAMQTHRFKQVKQAISLRSTNMLTEVVKRAYIIYATEGWLIIQAKAQAEINTFIKAYMTKASAQPPSLFPWASVVPTWPSFQMFGNFWVKEFWAVITLGTSRKIALPSPWMWVGNVKDQVIASIQDRPSSSKILSLQWQECLLKTSQSFGMLVPSMRTIGGVRPGATG